MLADIGRILFISTTGGAPWGGSEELWSDAALELVREHGCNVFASVRRWPQLPRKLKMLRDAGVNIHFRNYGNSLTSRIKRRVLGNNEYNGLIGSIDSGVILVSNGGRLPPADLARELVRARVRYLNLSHSNGFDYAPADEENEIYQSYLERSIGNLFIAETHAKLLERQLGMQLPNVSIVKNPVNIPNTFKWRQLDCGHLKREARFVFIGRLDPYKGLDIIFEVLSQERWKRREWSLSIFGDGPSVNNLRRMSGFLGIRENVRFCGHTDNVDEVLRDCDMLLLASRQEGMPLVILEAMLCARPVTATDVGDVGRVVVDGETGFLASAPTVASVSSAFERAWEKRADWEEIGLRARSFAYNFVPANAGRDLVCCVSAMLRERRAGKDSRIKHTT